MWYPSQQQQLPQQHSWYGYVHQFLPKQPTYSRTSYYSNGDELSSSCNVPINNENESLIHCQTTYGGNAHGKRKNKKSIEIFLKYIFF